MKFEIRNSRKKLTSQSTQSTIPSNRKRNDVKSKIHSANEARKMRKNLTEEKIDKILKDSFPASDPPSTY